MEKVILHTLSAYFSERSLTFCDVKPLIAAGLLDLDSGEFKFYTPTNAGEIPEIIMNAKLLITFDGSGCSIPILRKYFRLRGKTANIPPNGEHIQILEKAQKQGNKCRLFKLDELIEVNLDETRLVPQNKIWRLKPDECQSLCLSDINQLKKLYDLYQKGNLSPPPKKKSKKYTPISKLKKDAKLTIDLVPATSWFSNVRSEVSKKDWDIIRKEEYAKAGYRCQICAGVGKRHPVECHEIWDYFYPSETICTQKLCGFIALCPACHEVKHIGFARIRGREEEATAHLAKVNGWSLNDARRYVKDAFKMWRKRSMSEWDLDLSLLDDMNIEYKKSNNGI